MHTILLIGTDEMLLKTRAAILSKTNSAVVTSNAASALAIQEDRQCELVVLCHSLSPEICASLAEVIRLRWPTTRILQVVADRWNSASPVVDGTTSPEPDRLIGRTIELLHRHMPIIEAGDISIRGGIARAGPFAN